MALPRPFTRACCVFGGPIAVPHNLTPDELETYRRLVQRSLDEVQDLAERLAAGEPNPGPQQILGKLEALSWPEDRW